MALISSVDNKVATILHEDGGVYLTQSFDPTKEGFTPFANDAAAEAWADAFIVAESAEIAARAEAEEAARAAILADEAALLEGALVEEDSEEPVE
jgi:RNA polymerase subunit RPABC4/transcription elongation factor Spt4